MLGNQGVHVSTCPTALPLVTFIPNESRNFVAWRKSKRVLRVVQDSSSSNNTEQNPTPPSSKNPFSIVLDVPKAIWRQTLRPLSDFGFGKKSIWEGGVGLFIVSGAVIFALSMVWLRGFYFRSRLRKYQAVFDFSQACGICTGTPVRIRGVTVGNVIRINPSLKSIEAVVEVRNMFFVAFIWKCMLNCFIYILKIFIYIFVCPCTF